MTPEPPSIPIVDMHRIPACTSGACQQGRKQCPCPEACEVAESDPLTGWPMAAFWLTVVGFCALALAGVYVIFS